MRAERAGKGAPPVDRWNPPFCGDSEMRILFDGSWTYQGTPISRPALVRLFSSVLRRDDDGSTYLVTPVEKLSIAVEDVPFLAVEMDRDTRGAAPALTFRTNVGDVVNADAEHPLRFVIDPASGAFTPYVRVRGRLDARLTRPLAFDLADLIETGDDRRGFVASRGARFFLPDGAWGEVADEAPE
ncbi:hypothetical protein Sa4125_33830 [Aureimonas sp. SA4125]|uniref:DUF1285 domain-containing protein n=1 Tax=Aureimonas sp. SA4125 TaxID=2826993 RepID=UPI001CC3DA14|nr:DUF1285 domain-containing protein [Aureimonas sp. SA4125]BDA85841.1 hypothetical protein Sa4125_33830 [Aureimonas sp. SA4125]